jgi:hypothetical protein
MNWIMRALEWFSRVLLPVRLRPTVLQQELQQALDRSVAEAEKGAAKVGKHAERVEGAEPPKHGKAGTIVRWILHFLIIGLILAGLYFLNRWLQFERVLRSDLPVLHAFWLPLLFLLLYLMGWLCWWIWDLTGPERLTDEFPDIDHAWKEGVQNVGDAFIDLREVPLFLVLGRPLEGEENLFLAAQFGLRVREMPRWPEAPVRLSAGNEVAFVTCSGASVLGKHIELLLEEQREALSYKDVTAEAAGDVQAEPPAAVAAAGEANPGETPAVATIQQVLGTAQEEGRGPDQLTEEEQRVISLLVAEDQASKPAALTRRRVFLKNRDRVREMMARLRHLCQLIARHRQPYCPLNGILVVLPLPATDSDDDASQAASACELDLQVVRETLQVQCPVFVVGSDAEKSPGFRELLKRMPASQRDRRLGQRFPLVADVEPGAVPQMVQEGIGWFAHTFLPALVYNLFRVEPPATGAPASQGELPDAVAGNMRLYQFLGEMSQRRQRWARFLSRGLLLDMPGSFLFGGFYLAGTGPDAANDQAFVNGVFQRLPENQNYVSWTPEALGQERDYRRWTLVGWLFFLGLLAAIGVLVYRLWLA